MIDINLLSQFVEIANAGTLTDAAEMIHLSQPALSKNMKKLEADLGVTLFTRRKNKLALNDNGKYALELAKSLIYDAESFATKVHDFDMFNHTITLGVCTPSPVWVITPLITSIYPHTSLHTDIIDDEQLMINLDKDIYNLIITHHKPDSRYYYGKECSKEALLFSLPKNHKYARRKRLTFNDMNGETMLLLADIGYWNFIKADKMPDSRFIIQKDLDNYNDLVHASSFPSFTSNLASKYYSVGDKRVNVPITDKEATVVYYLVCKIRDKERYSALFSAF